MPRSISGAHRPFDQVRIERSIQVPVRCPRLAPAHAKHQPAFSQKFIKRIASQGELQPEITPAHLKELLATYTRSPASDFQNVFCYEAFEGDSLQINLYMLIIRLSAYTKQFTKRSDCIILLLFAQSFYCLVPAFFLIGIRNISSATSIIVSYASARILSW